MDRPYLLHLLTPAKNASPFDVNMAYDAGWSAVTCYSHVGAEEVAGLVQDAIFSRGPKGARRTGIFIGGREMALAMDMLDNARAAMVPPFEVSVFADPSGAFTTAAGLVAAVEAQLLKTHAAGLAGQRVVVLGGTGPVGSAAAVIAANAGAEVVILGRRKDKAEAIASLCNRRFAGGAAGIRGGANDGKDAEFETATVVLGAAAAGVQMMSEAEIAAAPHLKVVADVNAVPPAGIAGVGAFDDGAPLPGSGSGAVSIGALTVGNIKYQTQHHLLKRMYEAELPQYLHFEHAFAFARDYAQRT